MFLDHYGRNLRSPVFIGDGIHALLKSILRGEAVDVSADEPRAWVGLDPFFLEWSDPLRVRVRRCLLWGGELSGTAARATSDQM